MAGNLITAMRSKVDVFIVLLVVTVVLAAIIPMSSEALTIANVASIAAVCLLFFLHGTRLSISAITAGMKQWKIHASVLATSFVLFPVLGLAVFLLVPWAIPHELWVAIFFMCALPSTIQSSIAFTSVAKGNVPAAVVSATLSNVLGILVTPVLAMLVLGTSAAVSEGGLVDVFAELLLPFALGLAAHPVLGRWLHRHPLVTSVADRGSVLILVFSAFAASVAAGLWSALPASSFVAAAVIDGALLAAVLASTFGLSRALRLDRADRIVVMLCGSKKGLASGIAMASVLFGPVLAGIVIVPLMMYHLLQLLVCAALARRWSRSHAVVSAPIGPADSVAARRESLGGPLKQ